MAGERLPGRFSLLSQLWFRWTEKCFETATSHMQNVGLNFMKYILIYIFTIVIFTGAIAQSPSSIDEALEILGKYCSDSLKSEIVNTNDSELTKLFYPWGGDNKTLMQFTSHNQKLTYQKYYESLEIYSRTHMDLITLVVFKRNLQGLPVKHDSIVSYYRVIDKRWKYEDDNSFSVDSIRGVYIPKDLNDSFDQIDSFWADSTRTKVKNWTEDEFSAKVHHGFGMWMRNNWRLWGGSRLSKYFNEKGISHPDDMSGIIITSYHRYLNKEKIELEKQIKYYQNYWKKAEEEQIKQSKEDFSVFEVGDTIEFNHNFGFISSEQEELYDDGTCYVKGIILDKNKKQLELHIKLIDACDPKKAIISAKYDSYDPETKELLEKDVTERMKVGEEKWMHYTLWDY